MKKPGKMERRINCHLLWIGLFSLLVTAAVTTIVFHDAYERQVIQDIQQMGRAVAAGYGKLESIQQLDDFVQDGVRITLISPEGEVLFESDADSEDMENHLQREEIQQALQTGQGEARRRSATMREDTYYVAQRMEDGNVLRVASAVENMYAAFNDAVWIVVILGIIILLFSLGLSMYLTRQLIRPLGDMVAHIDDIEQHIPYQELRPFAFAIKEQQAKNLEVGRMRQEFTANVSHELKTPLTSISGYAEMIENGMVRREDVQAFAGKIHHEAGRLISLIGDIIKLSELDEPVRDEPSFSWVDLTQLAQETISLLEINAQKHQVRISCTSTEKVRIWGNADMLGELLYNLCDNAIRYNRQGGAVWLTVSQEDDVAVVSVEDTGIGIPKEHQSRIFERFYRVDKSRSKQTGGTGLGLAIVKHIVLQHNGTIQVESEVNRGTVIRVTLPIRW